MNPLDLIQQNFESFTKTEEIIAVYILNNPYQFARSNVDATVAETKTSKPAMIRFAKKLGYNGYSELKYDVAKFIISESYNENIEENNNDPIRHITDTYCKYINQLNETLVKNDLDKLATDIIKARKAKVLAINRTALSAKQLQLRALKIGVDIECINDSIAMYDVINTLNDQDICLIFTIKNNGKHYDELVENLKQRNVKVAVITMTNSLAFLKLCDHKILLPPVNRGYAKFIDEQAIYFVFVEILLNYLSTYKIE